MAVSRGNQYSAMNFPSDATVSVQFIFPSNGTALSAAASFSPFSFVRKAKEDLEIETRIWFRKKIVERNKKYSKL